MLPKSVCFPRVCVCTARWSVVRDELPDTSFLFPGIAQLPDGMYVCMYVCMYVFIYVRMYVYVCYVCVCMY